MKKYVIRSVAFVCSAFLLAPSAFAQSPSANGQQPTVFSILHDGAEIGRHSVTYQRDGNTLQVDIAIDIEIRVLFIPVFQYRHSNREVWRDGRLISIRTETDDNGTEYRVEAHATDEGLAVETPETSFVAPADTMPTSYWSKDTVGRSTLLDTQRGRLVEISVSPEGIQPIPTANGTLEAKRYNMAGDLELSLWYTPSGRWVKTAFSVRGAEIEYRLEDKQLRTAERPFR